MKQRFTFFLLITMCLFEAHAQVKSATLPHCGSLPTPAFSAQSVTIRSATTADVSVTWSNVGATSYKVSYKISSASTFSSSCTTTEVNCTIGGLLRGNTYTIRVEARRICQFVPGEEGEDKTSTTTTVTLPPPALPPPAPVGLALSFVTESSFGVSWIPVPGASFYRMDVSTTSNFLSGNILTDFAVTATNVPVTEMVAAGTTYFVRVRTVNNDSQVSGNSQIFSVTTMPPAPVNLALSFVLATSFGASWSPVSSALSYRLDVSLNPSFTSGNIITDLVVATTNTTVANLAPGTPYFFRVRAVNASGVSGNSLVVSVTTPLPAPLNIGTSVLTQTSFNVLWAPVSGASNYRLDVSSTPDFSSGNVVTDLVVIATRLTVNNLTSGTTYFLRVRAANASVVSANSQIHSVVTLSPSPVITSFTPSSGPVNTVVTITGTNFNEQRNNNFVFFGATKAFVMAATSTSLSVRVPFGATFEPISVTDTTTRRTGSSATPFVTTFSPIAQLNINSFGPKVQFGTAEIVSFKTADLDGDGKPDLAAIGQNKLFIYRNIALRSNLDSLSFAPPIELTTVGQAFAMTIDDLNGDGKPDILVANGRFISMFFNTSLPGILPPSFTRVDLDAGVQINSLATGDLDGDGRPDLVVGKVALPPAASILSVFQNNYAFDNATIFTVPGFGFSLGTLSPSAIAIGDLDNDLRPEIVVTGFGTDGLVSVFTNTSSSSAPISFGPKIDFAAPAALTDVIIADLNHSGTQDLIVFGSVAGIGSTVSVFDNSGSTPFLPASLAPRVDYSVSEGNRGMAIGDLNGDARPELIAGRSVLQNTSIVGNSRSSFSQSINYLPGIQSVVYSVVGGDMDQDGKPDLVMANTFSNSYEIALLHNNLASDSIPDVFVTSPAHGSTGFLPTVNVTAKALSGASTYTIQLSPNQDFSSSVLTKNGSRAQQFTGLSYGTRYFARVLTNRSPNFGKTTSFSTVPAEDLAFVISPVNGAVDLPPNLTVASNTVPGATSYTIELSTSPFFVLSDAIIKTGNRTQSFTGLSYNKTYYSRVRTEFTPIWGETRSFTIADASKFSFITSPADGATGLPTTLNLICSQVPGATEFTVIIRNPGEPIVRVFTSNSRTVRVSNLTPNTLQIVQVKTNLSTLFGPERTFTTGAALGALTAYPNPASNQVTIKNLKQGSSIKIVDALSGTLVETFRATGEEVTIETSKYRKGLYYVTQVNADGTEDESVRLVVN